MPELSSLPGDIAKSLASLSGAEAGPGVVGLVYNMYRGILRDKRLYLTGYFNRDQRMDVEGMTLAWRISRHLTGKDIASAVQVKDHWWRTVDVSVRRRVTDLIVVFLGERTRTRAVYAQIRALRGLSEPGRASPGDASESVFESLDSFEGDRFTRGGAPAASTRVAVNVVGYEELMDTATCILDEYELRGLLNWQDRYVAHIREQEQSELDGMDTEEVGKYLGVHLSIFTHAFCGIASTYETSDVVLAAELREYTEARGLEAPTIRHAVLNYIARTPVRVLYQRYYDELQWKSDLARECDDIARVLSALDEEGPVSTGEHVIERLSQDADRVVKRGGELRRCGGRAIGYLLELSRRPLGELVQ